MKIKKPWFYKLSEFSESVIEVEKNISATFFDAWKTNKKFIIWKKAEVYICWFLEKENDYKLEVFQKEKNSKVFINYLLFSENKQKLKAKIYSKIESDFSSSYVNIVSFVSKGWKIDLDWVLEFEKNFEKMSWKLEEENIFLWKSWQINALPTLLVKSNELKASHSCKIHKINDEKLFYLRSRWVKKDDAVFLLTQAKIKNIFGKIKEFDKDFFAKICRNIIFR